MSYCSNCGGRLNDNGYCPNCGGVSEAKVQPKRNMDSEVINCLKAFFTGSPMKAVETAARTKAASVWVIFGAVFVIGNVLTSLKVLPMLSPQTAEHLMGARAAKAVELLGQPQFTDAMPARFQALMLYTAGMSIWLFLMIAMMTSVLFVLAEEKPSFFQALNITAVSLFPLSVCVMLASLVTNLSFGVGAVLTVIGATSGIISYYFGVQQASSFKKSPFWLFFLCALLVDFLTIPVSYVLTVLLFPM